VDAAPRQLAGVTAIPRHQLAPKDGGIQLRLLDSRQRLRGIVRAVSLSMFTHGCKSIVCGDGSTLWLYT
jgi:hypothetical protein